MKRTTPAASVLASSPRLTAAPVSLADDSGRLRTAAQLRCSAASRSPRVSTVSSHLDRRGRVEHRLHEGRGGARQRADALRVRRQRLRLGGALGVLSRVAREDGEQAAQEGGDEQDGSSRQQGPEAAVRPSLGEALAVGLRGGGVEERALAGIELGPPGLDELERGGEPAAAVEVGGLPAAGVPQPRGVSDLLVRADPGAVLVEPAAQAWPLADQRLVGHLGGAVVERDEALLGEPAQERLDGPCGGTLRHELADGHAPARVLAALAELRHADQDAADQPALLVGQRVDERVGGAADGRRHTAGLAVALDGERAAVAALPGGAQRVREQRQGAGFGGDVAQDQLDEAGLELQPGEPGRLGDRALELVCCPSARAAPGSRRRRARARCAR